MVKLLRMGHVAVHVENMDRAVHFYRDLLGCEPTHVGDPDWANLHVGKDDLSLVLKEGHRHPPHFGFRVSSLEDLQKLYAQLKEKGIHTEEIHRHRDGTSTFYFKDPDENVLEALWDPRF